MGENKKIKEIQKLKDVDYEGTDEVKELKRELKKIQNQLYCYVFL